MKKNKRFKTVNNLKKQGFYLTNNSFLKYSLVNCKKKHLKTKIIYF